MIVLLAIIVGVPLAIVGLCMLGRTVIGTFLALALLLCPEWCEAATIVGICTSMEAADIARIDVGTSVYKVELTSVDAPEIDPEQPHGVAAAQFMRRLMVGQRVSVSDTGSVTWKDHGVVIGWGETLAANGFGMVESESKHLRSLEATARRQKLGIWSEPRPERPSVFRARMRKAARELQQRVEPEATDRWGVPLVRQISACDDDWQYHDSEGQYIVGRVSYVCSDGSTAYIWPIGGRAGARAFGPWPYSSISVQCGERYMYAGQLAFLAWSVAAQSYEIECVLPDPEIVEANQ